MDEQAKKLYEVSFLAKSENGAATMVGHLVASGAQIVNEGDLNKMKLAYPIEKEESAYFGCITCSIPTQAVSKVYDAVRLDKEIMRVMILTPTVIRENAESKGRPQMPELPGGAIRPKTPKVDAEEKPVLSNELLEEKLEEILK